MFFKGEFKDGVFSGQGKLKYTNISESFYEEAQYIGKFRNQKREGFGEM